MTKRSLSAVSLQASSFGFPSTFDVRASSFIESQLSFLRFRCGVLRENQSHWLCRLHASLDYGQVDEILNEDPHVYLETISRHCAQIHAAVYQSYVMYPIESALPA